MDSKREDLSSHDEYTELPLRQSMSRTPAAYFDSAKNMIDHKRTAFQRDHSQSKVEAPKPEEVMKQFDKVSSYSRGG